MELRRELPDERLFGVTERPHSPEQLGELATNLEIASDPRPDLQLVPTGESAYRQKLLEALENGQVDLYKELVYSDFIPEVTKEPAGDSIPLVITGANTVRTPEREIALQSHQLFALNALLVHRDREIQRADVYNLGFYATAVSDATRDAAWVHARHFLMDQLNHPQPILIRGGNVTHPTFQLSENVVITDTRLRDETVTDDFEAEVFAQPDPIDPHSHHVPKGPPKRIFGVDQEVDDYSHRVERALLGQGDFPVITNPWERRFFRRVMQNFQESTAMSRLRIRNNFSKGQEMLGATHPKSLNSPGHTSISLVDALGLNPDDL